MSLQSHSDQGKFLSLSTIHLTPEGAQDLKLLASGHHSSEYVFALELGFIVRLNSFLMSECLDGDIDPSLKTLLETIAAAGFKIVEFDTDAEVCPHLPRNDAEPMDPEIYAKNGLICPNCFTKEGVETTGPMDNDENSAWQEVHCLGCGAGWKDNYKLVGYSDLVVPGQDDAEVEE